MGLPRPLPCESNTKVPKFDGNNTDCCSDWGEGIYERQNKTFQKLGKQHLLLL